MHLVVIFSVAPNGQAGDDVTFEGDTASASALTECVAQTVAAWSFAVVTSQDSVVRFPMDLSYDPPPPG
jgi:hypothetical protein